MKLEQLVKLHKSGALKVTHDDASGLTILGGVEMSDAVCEQLAYQIGWERFDDKPWKIIDKTDKFIKGLLKNLSDEALEGVEISFRNFRRMNTMNYHDRIKLVSPNYDITVLYHMPGLGGTYAVFTESDGFRQPEFACRTMKQLCEYINELV